VDDASLALQRAQGSLAALQASQAKTRATEASQIDAAQRALTNQQRTLA